MGEQAFEEVKREFGARMLRAEDPVCRFVKGVAGRIIKASGLETDGGVQWEVFVVRDQGNVNA